MYPKNKRARAKRVEVGGDAELAAWLEKDRLKGIKKKARAAENRARKKAGLPLNEKEQKIQKKILDFLRSRNIFAWKSSSTGQLVGGTGGFRMIPGSARGCPDVTGILRGGRILQIEVKSLTGRLSPVQREWLECAQAFGAFAFVARSVQDVEEALAPYFAWVEGQGKPKLQLMRSESERKDSPDRKSGRPARDPNDTERQEGRKRKVGGQ